MQGGIDVVKIKFYANDLMQSIKRALPAMYPPTQPYAFPKVPENISISSITPTYSATPPPLLPYKPIACTSSIKVNALYCFASYAISLIGEIDPDME